MKSVKKLFWTTLALTATSFVMKTVAVWFNVYLASLVGSAGIGVFQLILSVYALSKTLAYGGMNLAATRLCIDQVKATRHSVSRLLITAGILGLAALGILTGLSEVISEMWIGTDQSREPLIILSLSLPFVALSSALNGYMTAARKMSRYSLIQLLEQFCRIGATIYIVSLFLKEKTNPLSLVSWGITISEIFSFFLSILCYRYDMFKGKFTKHGEKGFLKRMLRIAVPDALGSWVRSGLNTVEHLLIPIGIRKTGARGDRAFSEYGAVQGMALPILLYPSSILSVISSLLVPEIAEKKGQNNQVQVDYIVNRVLKSAVIFSMFVAGVMFFFSEELSYCVYETAEAARFLRLLAPLIPVMYLDMTTDGMLKGLDLQFEMMKINVIDSVLCVLLVWITVPILAVDGYILTIYVAEIINFLMSFRKLCQNTRLRLGIKKDVLAPFLGTVLSCQCAKVLLPITEKPTPNLIGSIGVGFLFYLGIMLLSGGITKEETSWFLRLIKP